MENSKGKCLDIQSLYQSNVSKEGVADDEVVGKKKRKSRKRVALSSFEHVSKKSRSSLHQVCGNGVSGGSGGGGSDRLLSGLSLKLTSFGGLSGISVNLDSDGNVICIPKGRRGSVGAKRIENKDGLKTSGSSSSVDQIAKLNGEKKKVEGNQVINLNEPSESKLKPSGADQVVKLSGKSKSAGKGVASPKVEKNGGFAGFKVKRSHKKKVSSAHHDRNEGGQLDLNNGHASSTKQRRSHKEKRHSAIGSETVVKEVEPSVDKKKKDSVIGSETVVKKVEPTVDQKRRDSAIGSETVAKKVEPSVDKKRKDSAIKSEAVAKKVEPSVDRKRKDSAKRSEAVAKKVEPSVDKKIIGLVLGIEAVTKKVEPSVDKKIKDSVLGSEAVSKRVGPSFDKKIKDSAIGSGAVAKKVEPSVDKKRKDSALGSGAVANKVGPSVDKKIKDSAIGSGAVAKKVGPSVDKKRKDSAILSEAVAKKIEPSVDKKRKDLATKNEAVLKKVDPSVDQKRKDSVPGSETIAKKAGPSVDNLVIVSDDSQDDDEENLEENAARMLSSRFDPSCTGFSQKNRSSESPSANGLSLSTLSGRDIGSHGVNSLACSASADADDSDRILRPRKRHRNKSLSKKRRHFYEILSSDLDAYWCLNRRIKVFWPLDKIWYYGLVIDYDPETKLHHVKYDDREEEWINLQNERFKLLLLPSEVPDLTEPKESDVGDKHTDTERTDLTMDDDTYNECHMDSEPIISWLARSSSRRFKSSPSGVLKKQKTSHLSPNLVPPLLSAKNEDACGSGDAGLMEREESKPYCNSALSAKLTDVVRCEKSMLERPTSSKEGKSPVVYVRRRFRKSHKSKSVECLGSDGIFWEISEADMMNMNIELVKSKNLRFKLLLPICPLLGYAFGGEILSLLHTVMLHQHGTIVTMWPDVHMELLFVDNIVGLRFFLFEGCLQQAIAFVFLVLTVFHEPSKQGKYVDPQMPVTSIRFKFSSIQDLRKQHVFAYYSFTKVNLSKWLYIDCKLQRHCLLTKQLPLPECTYDNIKALESGSKQLPSTSVGWDPSFEVLPKKSVQDIITMGVFKEPLRVNWSSRVMHGILPPVSLSFTAAPTFFIGLHLKLLMERSIACVRLRDDDTVFTLEPSGKTCLSAPGDFTQVEYCSGNASANTLEIESNLGTHMTVDACSEWLSCVKSQLETGAVSLIIDEDHLNSPQHLQNGEVNVDETPSCSKAPGNTAIDVVSEQFIKLPPIMSKSHASPVFDGMSVEIPPCEEVERKDDAKSQQAQPASDLGWNISDDMVCSPSPTGPRSFWPRSRNGLSSSPLGHPAYVLSDGKENFIRSGFGNGPKKPRTQVQYALPFGGFDFSPKHKTPNQNGLPYRRARRANEKRTSDGSRSSERNLEMVACDANVLITDGDKGWRECGARVILELADQNEWKLAVKLFGSTKYSYKVRHAWQAGSSNRYTHAMMWKVATDWILEFPDRSQWMLFKEMHEECHNRNIRAALVKNIPIPGVCLIDETDDNITEVLFIHSSPKYFRQVETDVDMAMDPSRILYDMDSDDEKWVLQNRKSSQTEESICEEITHELFEKTMDMFEKVAYAQQRDHFTDDEIEDLMVGVGSVEVIKAIYEHWRQKRQRKEMPLIRQLQAPLWERYQKQVKVWEQSVTKSTEKPAMFAFCLKPRGLEALNKGSKHRPHRRFSVSGHSHAVSGDHDGLHAFGRKLNGFAVGDERGFHDSSDASSLLQVSTGLYSPRDGGGPGYFSLNSDASEWNHRPKLHRNKLKKIGTFLPPGNQQMVASCNQRAMGKRNGIHRWNTALPEWPNQKNQQPEGSHRHSIEQFGGSDLDEFRLRDASGAAQHALNMAKLKRERAQRLLYRADLAIHKAVVALMTADAIKASSEDSNGDDE